MTLRQRVRHLYAARCAWCQSTTRGLEYDHVLDDGKGHRREIGRETAALERWLWQAYQQTGFPSPRIQLLCWRCHGRRSGRFPPMPARPGAQQHNVTLDQQLSDQLIALAAKGQYQGSKSAVVTEALRLLLEGTTSETVVDGLHQQISVLHSAVGTARQEIRFLQETVLEALGRLQRDLAPLVARLETLERQVTRPVESSAGTPPKPTRWQRLWEIK
jgi:Arc/MetJ-type ribon-helix-helix transcriptional regulator